MRASKRLLRRCVVMMLQRGADTARCHARRCHAAHARHAAVDVIIAAKILLMRRHCLMLITLISIAIDAYADI